MGNYTSNSFMHSPEKDMQCRTAGCEYKFKFGGNLIKRD